MLIDFIFKGFAGLPPAQNARETDFLRQITEKDRIIAEKDDAIAEKDRIIAQLQAQLTALRGAP